YFTCTIYTGPFISISFFCSHATASPVFYTLSLHDALPICLRHEPRLARGEENHAALGLLEHDGNRAPRGVQRALHVHVQHPVDLDRKSTRLNSSHVAISYAVFCLKKKRASLKPNG